jgi:hypothetical protein
MSTISFHARHGGLLIGVGVIGMAATFLLTSGGVGGASAICLLLGAIQLIVPLVVLEHDHFMARKAVLGSSRRILYKDVRRLVVEGNRLHVHVVPEAGDVCTIRLGDFSPDARDRIERELGQRMAAAQG